MLLRRKASDGRSLWPGRFSLLKLRPPHAFIRVVFTCGALLCCGMVSYAQSNTESEPPSTPGQAIPGTQGVSPYGGSVPAKLVPGIVPISLQDAINRGLRQNLGALLSNADIRSARGQRWEALSALLPHVSAQPFVDQSQINLGELGLTGKVIPAPIPTSVGPFSYFDARLGFTQSFDWKSFNNVRSARENLKSAEFNYKDARDLVVLAVGYTYLQAIADAARVETAQAQVETAQALSDQASDQVTAVTKAAL